MPALNFTMFLDEIRRGEKQQTIHYKDAEQHFFEVISWKLIKQGG